MSFSIIGPTAASLVSYHMPCTLIEICGKVMYGNMFIKVFIF